MSKWNDFCTSVGKAGKATADKTKAVANKASLKMKVGNLQSKADGLYKELGKLCYLHEVGKAENAEEMTAKIKEISDVNKQINALNAELREIKKAEEEAKAAKEAEREAKKAAKAAEKEAAAATLPDDDTKND